MLGKQVYGCFMTNYFAAVFMTNEYRYVAVFIANKYVTAFVTNSYVAVFYGSLEKVSSQLLIVHS